MGIIEKGIKSGKYKEKKIQKSKELSSQMQG